MNVVYIRLTFFLLLFVTAAKGTHLRSGEISVSQESINIPTVRITITVFTNTTNTSVLFGGEDDWLDFGDGTRMLIPEILNTPRPDLGEGVAMASFVVFHTYPHYGTFLISYSEPNRNEGILNMDASVNTRFYIETQITLAPGKLYQTPSSILPPISYAQVNSEFSLSLAYTDSPDHRLVYERMVPKREREKAVVNYRFPENYTIDRYSGQIKWDTKFQQSYTQGEYAFAVKISQINADGTIAGYVVRDFQIILTDGSKGEVKDDKALDGNNRIYVPGDQTFQIKVIAEFEKASSVTLSSYSELSSTPEVFEFNVYDSTGETGKLLKVAKLKLRNTTAIRRDSPYPITVRAVLKENGVLFAKDISYLFFTKDVPTEVTVVVATEREISRMITVYPNPFTNFITVETSLPSVKEFSICDMNGKVISQGVLSEKSQDLSSIAAGVYFLTICEGNRRSIFKIVKY